LSPPKYRESTQGREKGLQKHKIIHNFPQSATPRIMLETNA
jgi:hypothetical protein